MGQQRSPPPWCLVEMLGAGDLGRRGDPFNVTLRRAVGLEKRNLGALKLDWGLCAVSRLLSSLGLTLTAIFKLQARRALVSCVAEREAGGNSLLSCACDGT